MKISASLYGADPLRLAEAVAIVSPFVASLHIDVMDGCFAPAFGFGERLVRSLIASGARPVDVHLMTEKPEPWAKRFAALGAHRVAFHIEGVGGVNDASAVAKSIRKEGSLAYVALLPETPISRVLALQDHIDGLLLLTAPPGGGALNATALARVWDVPKRLPLIVDGHIEPAHFDTLKSSGVDLAVVGAALFATDHLADRAKALHLFATT